MLTSISPTQISVCVCAVNRNAHRVNFTHQMNGVSWDVRLAIQTGYAIESAHVSPTALNDDRRRRDANARLGFTIHHDFGFGCTRMCNIFAFPIKRRQRFMACNIVEINLLIYLRTFILYALYKDVMYLKLFGKLQNRYATIYRSSNDIR